MCSDSECVGSGKINRAEFMELCLEKLWTVPMKILEPSAANFATAQQIFKDAPSKFWQAKANRIDHYYRTYFFWVCPSLRTLANHMCLLLLGLACLPRVERESIMAWATPLAITQVYGFLIIVFHEMRFYDGYDKIGSEEQHEMFQGLGYAGVTMTSRGYAISMILPFIVFILAFAYVMFLKRMQRKLEEKQRMKQRAHAELGEVLLDEPAPPFAARLMRSATRQAAAASVLMDVEALSTTVSQHSL